MFFTVLLFCAISYNSTTSTVEECRDWLHDDVAVNELMIGRGAALLVDSKPPPPPQTKMLYKSAWVRICVICTYKKLSNLFITYFEILNAQYSVLYKPPQFKHTCIDPEKLLSLSTYAIGSMKKIVRVQLRATGPAREGVSGLSGFQRQRHSRGGKQARTFLFYSQRQ